MRILVWNMGAGSPGGFAARHEAAWRYLLEQPFDIALLQESQEPPRWAAEDLASIVWRPKHAHRGGRRWGSAVISRRLELEAVDPGPEHTWLAAFPGSTAIARTAGNPEWLASVHLGAKRVPPELVDRLRMDDVEVPTRDGSVWETHGIPIDLLRLFADGSFVFGGDFNADPRMDDRRGFAGGNRRTFEAYAEAGAVDLRQRHSAEAFQTFFRPGAGTYQLDHAFADPYIEQRSTDYSVDTGPVTGEQPLSDHAPITVTLEARPARLSSAARRDRAMTDFIETTTFVDPATGELFEPSELPDDPTPDDEDN